jgi:hypothetical protein
MGDNCPIHNDAIAMARNERADVEPDAGTRRRNDIPWMMAIQLITPHSWRKRPLVSINLKKQFANICGEPYKLVF